ncbi:MAG TPA: HAD-IIIA family hydrolase [Gemmatales bacterium]|nr:HAD-IIIA family hydrolase [Gemmatales bacterium]
MNPARMALADRCRQIEALVLDVDGVLTGGGITYTGEGWEIKTFHVRDGSAIKQWQKAGKKLGILSGRNSLVTTFRARELGIDAIEQGNADKIPGFQKLLESWGLKAEQVAYMGDDLPDVPILQQAGLALTPADGCGEAKAVAHYISRYGGGYGAVRSAIETILACQGRWPLDAA